jgi:dienelactone hydrolase
VFLPGGFSICRRSFLEAPMSEWPEEHISRKRVVYRITGADAVDVERDVPFTAANGRALMMDLYRRAGTKPGTRLPAVVMALGYRDAGYANAVGCPFKAMAFTTDWARLFAASGMIAIAYTNEDPTADLLSLLRYLRHHGEALGIDAQHLGILGASGNGPVALLALMYADLHIRCAVLGWPFLMDVDDATHVGTAAAQWKFANACDGKTIDDLPRDVPIFIARAGQDRFPGLNDAVDRFAAKALHANLPVTIVNHPAAPHAFDIFDDSDESREIIRQMIAFMRFHLERVD